MSNVLTFKKAKPSTRMGDKRKFEELKDILHMVAIPHPPVKTFAELQQYVQQEWVAEAIHDRLEWLHAIYEAEYETKH